MVGKAIDASLISRFTSFRRYQFMEDPSFILEQIWTFFLKIHGRSLGHEEAFGRGDNVEPWVRKKIFYVGEKL